MKNTLLLIFAFLLSEFYNVAVSQDFAFYNINNLSGISMREVTAVVRDDDGFVWAASRTGVLRVATDDYQLYSLPFTTTDVMQIKMACRGGLLVVATQNGQIFRYNRVLDKFDLWFTFSSLLGNEDWVTNLLIDVDGKVWISTSTGIFLWTGEEIVRAFDNIAGISNMTLLEGCYALAFVQSSIYRINTRNRTKTKLQGHLPYIISSARYDAHTHRVWIGTYNAGLWQYDLIGQMLRKAAIPQFPKLIVRDILIPDTTSLWVGVDGGGIWILDSETCQVRQVLRENLDNPSSLRGNSVYSLLVDDHRVWTATNSGGLQYTEITRSNVEHLVHGINNPQSLHNNEVNHIVTDSRGNLWIATNDGISLREAYTHRWKQLYRGCQQVFLSLATDKKGRIYAGTYGEGLYVLCCYNLFHKQIRTFATQPQLANVSFSVNAACQLPDGRLAFGSNNGVVLFYPSKINTIHPSGRIYFSDIHVSGRSIRETVDFNLSVPIDSLSTLHLNYPQNSFTLSVLPLGSVSKSVSFSWRLVGQDETWSTYTTNRYINYTNLPAGNYTLCIRLYDGSLLSQRQLSIVVEPPFWQTVWFRLLVVTVIISLLFLVIRYYVQYLHHRYSNEKIRFFTRMAHDIRTSLMLIKAPIEELHKEKSLSQWGTRCLTLASEQTARLSDTVTQLLDFEKLDVGCEQPLFTDFNLTDLIRRRTGIYASYAAGKQIDIKVDLMPEDYWVQADVRMLERVVDNLLSNAVKYSTSGELIEVTFTGKATEWVLRVKDYGIGISKAAQRKLFHEFYRSDNAVNAQIVGSGIGLLMTKRYISIHGGKITVTSELGVGTTFDITVPLRLASQMKTADVPVADKIEMSENGDLAVHDMHILIVEDNHALCEFMVHPLREHFRVTTANDGQQAWEMLNDLQPDLIVSDVVMPRMDGFELCRKIKSTYETSHIPVILLTVLSDKTNQLHGLGLGADNYLVKPFDMALLASRITSIIRNRRTVLQKALEAKRDDVRSIVANRMNDEFIKKAVECVRANIANENFGKEEFASALALSQSLLYKKIKALTNLSVVEFIRSIRLNYAMEKLRSGEYNVTEVSEMCGFNTSAYFSKVFKEYFGKTPTEVMQNSAL